MSDIIQLLPDSVANQIAAGEVIQRPASVVKELVENALDSGATEIKIIIIDAGRTLIQVVDNGCGMSETDARLSFERHATSKIRKADDLFSIRTMGFRGEALASIASVAQVELKTTLSGNEMGTCIVIEGSKVIKQEAVASAVGSNFMVKNLFFNIPARRKFLKSNSAELRHITSEIQRIALINPNVAFIYLHNDVEIYNLCEESILQRIVSLFGHKMKKNLVKIEVKTSLVNISGYVGILSSAKKSRGDQYFFVNNRFMRHPYLHKAVMQAYDQLIPADTHPPYFIHFELDPSTIDVNIHPTKTEIKFEEEAGIWPILASCIREALGKSNETPSIDFDQANSVSFPLYNEAREVYQPQIVINPNYNPFTSSVTKSAQTNEIIIPSIWNDTSQELPLTESSQTFFQFKNKYILTPSKSGMMLIDQHRAHFRILFERYLLQMQHQRKNSQRILFPESIEVNAQERMIVLEYLEDFKYLGFDLIADKDKETIIVEGVPANLSNQNATALLEKVLQLVQEEKDLKTDAQKSLAKSLARISAIKAGQVLSNEEMNNLFDQLFSCDVQIFSPDGLPIMTIIETEYIEQKFK